MLGAVLHQPIALLPLLHAAAAYDYANQESLYPNDFEGDSYVSNFHEIPRIRGDNDFNRDGDYYIGVLLMVFSWLTIGVVMFVFVPCYMCCCKRTQGASYAKMIPCVLILAGCAVGWTGVGYTLDGSEGVGEMLRQLGNTLIDCNVEMEDVETKLNAMGASLDTIADTTCPALASDLQAARDYVTYSLGEVGDYKGNAHKNAKRVHDLSNIITDNSDAAGRAMLGVLMLFAGLAVFALVLLWRTICVEGSGRDLKDVCCMGCCRRVFFWVAFFTMFICFILSGVLMGISAMSADFCAKPGANLLEPIDPTKPGEKNDLSDGDMWNITYYYTNGQCSASEAAGDYGMLTNSIRAASDDITESQSEVDRLNNITLLNYTCSMSATQTSVALTAISSYIDGTKEDMSNAAVHIGCDRIHGHYIAFIKAFCGEDAVVLGMIFMFVATMLTAVLLFILLVIMPSKSSFEPGKEGSNEQGDPNIVGQPGQIQLAAVGAPVQPTFQTISVV